MESLKNFKSLIVFLTAINLLAFSNKVISTEPEFIQIYLNATDANVSGYVDIFCKDYCVAQQESNLYFGFDYFEQYESAGQVLPYPPQQLRYPIDLDLPTNLSTVQPLLITIEGLLQQPPLDLSVFITTSEKLRVVYMAPAKGLQKVQLNGTNRESQYFYSTFNKDSIQIAILPTNSTLGRDIFKSFVNFSLPLITAIVILLGTTCVNRILSVQKSQQYELGMLIKKLEKIKENENDKNLRQELITYIEEMSSKPDYGGFPRSFTAPLDEIKIKGNIDDIPWYEDRIKAIKLGVNYRWVFFIT